MINFDSKTALWLPFRSGLDMDSGSPRNPGRICCSIPEWNGEGGFWKEARMLEKVRSEWGCTVITLTVLVSSSQILCSHLSFICLFKCYHLSSWAFIKKDDIIFRHKIWFHCLKPLTLNLSLGEEGKSPFLFCFVFVLFWHLQVPSETDLFGEEDSGLVAWTELCPYKFMYGIPNPQCDFVWRWSYKEVIKVAWGHKIGFLI